MSEQGRSRWDGLERDQLVDELVRANRRLAGTLNIVLSTLDSTDVAVLLSRVLQELSDTLDATGTIIYLTEQDGFRLRGASAGVAARPIPAYVPFGRTLSALAAREGRAMRLRVLPPSGEELRQGRLAWRQVLDEDSRDVHRVEAATLPPFVSLLAAPVWFGRQVIALLEVGWTKQRVTRREDVELLEAVAQYLAVQLVGAFSAMRQRREAELREVGVRVQTGLLQGASVDADAVEAALAEAARALEATLVPVRVNVHQRLAMAALPKLGETSLPVDVDALASDEPSVASLVPGGPMHDWLEREGESCVGALVGLGRVAGADRAALLLRPVASEPFDDVELAFLRRVVEGVRDASEGNEARAEDKRISQALQTGMRNELQRVEGLTTDAVYSSATAAAFVGGDFYDLIALPARRACVVMGDVSGKGVEAASVSAAVRTALGAYAWEGVAPARMVSLLNNFLLGFSKIETFVTLFVGVIDLAAGRLTYCSAGHPPAIVRRGRTGELVPLDVQSGLVGAFREMEYRDGQIDLAAGDLLLLYTDGTTEARSPAGAFFGEDGLREAVVREAPAGVDGLPARLLATLDDFSGRNLADDIAIVAVRVDRVGGRGAAGGWGASDEGRESDMAIGAHATGA